MAAWKRCSDMRKVCGNIFEDHNIQLNLNVHCRFGGDLVKSSGYTIFILVYAESSKSIKMLAYRVSFCCCRSKVCSDAFVNLFSPSFLQNGCNHNVRQQIGYKQYTYSDCALYIFCLQGRSFLVESRKNLFGRYQAHRCCLQENHL